LNGWGSVRRGDRLQPASSVDLCSIGPIGSFKANDTPPAADDISAENAASLALDLIAPR